MSLSPTRNYLNCTFPKLKLHMCTYSYYFTYFPMQFQLNSDFSRTCLNGHLRVVLLSYRVMYLSQYFPSIIIIYDYSKTCTSAYNYVFVYALDGDPYVRVYCHDRQYEVQFLRSYAHILHQGCRGNHWDSKEDVWMFPSCTASECVCSLDFGNYEYFPLLIW